MSKFKKLLEARDSASTPSIPTTPADTPTLDPASPPESPSGKVPKKISAQAYKIPETVKPTQPSTSTPAGSLPKEEAAYLKTSIYLRKHTFKSAQAILHEQGEQDLSELLESLLSDWVQRYGS